MTDLTRSGERELIGSGQDDEQVAGVLDGHEASAHRIRPPVRFFTADRRVVIAVSVAVACFSAAVLVAIVSQYRTAAGQRSTITAQAEVILAQDHTIDVERSRSAQIERQSADLQSQVSDQQNQTLCRAQIANDYETIRTQFDLLAGHRSQLAGQRDQTFREALSVALQGDIDGFRAKLDEASAIDPQIADLDAQIAAREPMVAAAAQARQESVATCQKATTSTTTTAPR